MPKTPTQREYLAAIDKHDIVFGVGPAGTGKTYLAMAQAVAEPAAKRVSRIILTRPAVEAGEKLGFLPGDLQEKVNPYLRPLYDALHDMLDAERDRAAARARHHRGGAARVHARPDAQRRLRHPRRGAEHDHRADEDVPDAPRHAARKAVVTGDVTQIDLPAGRPPGSIEALRVVRDIEEHRLHPLHRAGRRPPQARAADRAGLRGAQPARATGRTA